jgi:hypothetical protein
LEKAGADAHQVEQMTPLLASQMDAQTKAINSTTELHNAQTDRIHTIIDQINKGDGKGGGFDISSIIGSLDPDKPDSVAIGTRLAMMAVRKNTDIGSYYAFNPDELTKDTQAMQGLVGAKLQQRQQQMQIGRNLLQGTKALFGFGGSQPANGQAISSAPGQVISPPSGDQSADPTGAPLPTFRNGPPGTQMPYPRVPLFNNMFSGQPGQGPNGMPPAPANPSASPGGPIPQAAQSTIPIAPPARPTAGNLPIVLTKQDWAALPIGAAYRAPDGTPMIKRTAQ